MRRFSRIPLAFIVIGSLIVLLLGTVRLLRENLDRYERQSLANVRFDIYLRDDTTPAELSALVRQVEGLRGYEWSSYRDRLEAYKVMQQTLGEQLLPDGGFNPFPASLTVKFTSELSTSSSLVQAERELSVARCVEEINFPQEWLKTQEGVTGFFVRFSRAIEYLLVVFMLCFSYWSFRRKTRAEREETRIMKLLGASVQQIALPILGRGTVLAILASIVGVTALYFFWQSSIHLPLQLAFISAQGLVFVLVISLVASLISSMVVAVLELK